MSYSFSTALKISQLFKDQIFQGQEEEQPLFMANTERKNLKLAGQEDKETLSPQLKPQAGYPSAHGPFSLAKALKPRTNTLQGEKPRSQAQKARPQESSLPQPQAGYPSAHGPFSLAKAFKSKTSIDQGEKPRPQAQKARPQESFPLQLKTQVSNPSAHGPFSLAKVLKSRTSIDQGEKPRPQAHVGESAEALFQAAQTCLKEIFSCIQRGEPFAIGLAAEIAQRITAMMVASSSPQETGESTGAASHLLQKATTSPCSSTDLVLHSLHVCLFAVKVAIGLKYSLGQLTELALAALLHDVGMLKVPRHILEKPEKLTAEEYAIIRQHPLEGYEILKDVAEPWRWLAQVALQEQEREKGQGYPRGIKGDEIHPYARIIGLVDVFDALTHPRSYREPVPPFEAMRTITRQRDKEFSFPIIKAMMEQLSLFPIHSNVRLNSGEIGKVERINGKSPLRPVVRILYDSRGNPLPGSKVVDLEKDKLLYITKSLSDRELEEWVAKAARR